MITNEQKQKIEENWENDFWASSSRSKSANVVKLKEYFLEENSTPYKIDISDEYVLKDIFLGVLHVLPEKAWEYILYEDNLNSSKVKYIFKSSSYVILRHLPFLLEKYEEEFIFCINKLLIESEAKAQYIEALLEYDFKIV